ncbi:hypothetical protein Pcinc_026570 [Petrolisthes cinctipes]|uniref:Uncharacterized protein n=1 Tax=Petrolisthes cinctipes TaxID=88211 RepID=A0AAE1F725_PETCI|nr:hypothetical protein Pcinc_026570 [Petrolisthes cinctipes]
MWVRTCVLVVVVVVVTARGGGRGKGGGGGHTLDEIIKGQHLGQHQLGSAAEWMVMRVGDDDDGGGGGVGGGGAGWLSLKHLLESCTQGYPVLYQPLLQLLCVVREVGGVSQGVTVVEVEGGEVESWFSSPTNSPLLSHLKEGGDPRFTCRAYILLMSHTEDHAARFLEETQVRVWPETRVVGVGPPSLVHSFLAHPALTNTAHALYLATHTQAEPQTKARLAQGFKCRLGVLIEDAAGCVTLGGASSGESTAVARATPTVVPLGGAGCTSGGAAPDTRDQEGVVREGVDQEGMDREGVRTGNDSSAATYKSSLNTYLSVPGRGLPVDRFEDLVQGRQRDGLDMVSGTNLWGGVGVVQE